LGREHVLDVKVRSRQLRSARVRMAAVSLTFVFTVVFFVFLVYRGGAYVLNQLVYENRAFAVEEIDIQTDGVLALDQIRRWAGVRPGENLLALDLARVKRNLELVSRVESASIERILPRTLRIRVVEREPLAQLNIPRPRDGGGLEMASFQLDTQGYVMLPLDPQHRASPIQTPEQLPVISGPNGNEVQAGRPMESPQVLAALRLLAIFQDSPMSGLVDIERIDVSTPEVLTAITGQKSEIIFDIKDLERQVRRWREIHLAGQRANKALATLDLAVTNNIPARWVEASAVPTPAPKSTPKNHKKKHV
jgi:cell division septal protein FtsQ